MNALLDTHFLLWIILDVQRLDEFPWLERYRPWGVSPISFLEIQYLSEVGRFVVDEAPLLNLVRHSLTLSWTRDPFDRLLAAHSSARRLPLCTLDRTVRTEHSSIVPELRLG